MERSIFNALFAAQSPDGRRIRYYTPFECSRAYFPGDTYCCPNNYRRIISELPTMIYYRAPHELTVNLYTASTAKVDLGGGLSVTVQQETDYPSSGRVLLKVDPSQPAEFSLRLRIPRWCQRSQGRGQRPAGSGAGSQRHVLCDLAEVASRRPGRVGYAHAATLRPRPPEPGGPRGRDAGAGGVLPQPRAEPGFGHHRPAFDHHRAVVAERSDPRRFGAAGRDGLHVFRRGSRVPGIPPPSRSCDWC